MACAFKLDTGYHKTGMKKSSWMLCIQELFCVASIHREGQQRDGTGALDGLAQLTLMLGAVAAHPAGQDLAALMSL